MAAFLGSDESVSCKVVVNHEGQYSIWPVERPNPPGWRDEGFHGARSDCVAHIDNAWTDMRPLSTRSEQTS
ncbi:MbtH family protein [Myxococcus sp. CA051A]|uniref:MbtH family protein n=1 Tax=Myxococcus llanfairpwllgwyngyllgogerychwyrndrobwllllantysiliogogogochensis TaxID=2590453 RepID=A0A540WU39_9BACT|nr:MULTISPECIES: MbtH family protein [Myxococcus]NTX01873.1 MbtH family protein [Myxococcus sp. CA040A]NTX16521.1 MbtH family protein [Myxococcus sp. CA056]NTX38699.1 MbtH family protein [Myxococcus sp. CA033]NTX57425.1 MbtH family protein [Myxococcus sp. CA039A]NTX62734.1 MbtH family protein [Myxococcus sp. CA051A]